MHDPSKFVYVMWAVHFSVAVGVCAFGLLGQLYFFKCIDAKNSHHNSLSLLQANFFLY